MLFNKILINNLFVLMKCNLLDIFNLTSYHQINYTKIANFLLKNFSLNQDAKLYLTNRSIFNEKIFVVSYQLPVNYNEQIIKVSLLIYLPSNFPNDIEFYFEKKPNLVLSDYYSNKIINRKNLRINFAFFCNWIPEKLNLFEILENLKLNFNVSFPVFNSNKFNNVYEGSCILNYNNCLEIIFKGIDVYIKFKHPFFNNNKKIIKINDKNLVPLGKYKYEEKIIGKGGFGRVFKGIDENNNLIAIKQIDLEEDNKKESINLIKNEINIMKIMEKNNKYSVKDF